MIREEIREKREEIGAQEYKSARTQEHRAECQSGFSVFPPLSSFFLKFVLVCLCVLTSGCSMVKKIQHMSQLLTLKHYSEEQEAIAQDVDEQNRLFEELLQEIKTGKFVYQSLREIEQRFGPPVFIRPSEYQGQPAEQRLYRRSRDFSGRKVYMYFDGEGKLIGFEQTKNSI